MGHFKSVFFIAVCDNWGNSLVITVYDKLKWNYVVRAQEFLIRFSNTLELFISFSFYLSLLSLSLPLLFLSLSCFLSLFFTLSLSSLSVYLFHRYQHSIASIIHSTSYSEQISQIQQIHVHQFYTVLFYVAPPLFELKPLSFFACHIRYRWIVETIGIGYIIHDPGTKSKTVILT